MEKETIKENIEKISGIEKAINEIKALFTADKKEEATPEVKTEEPAKVETPEAKVEFNHVEFEKNYNEFKTSNEAAFKSMEEKFVAFEAQIKTANDTITKQGEILTQTFALVEKLAEAPVALSKQTKKEGVTEKKGTDWEADLKEWRKTYLQK